MPKFRGAGWCGSDGEMVRAALAKRVDSKRGLRKAQDGPSGQAASLMKSATLHVGPSQVQGKSAMTNMRCQNGLLGRQSQSTKPRATLCVVRLARHSISLGH